ncbi:hypothetical protein TW86_14090 [Halomonas sp. S2151]|uniref:hypothetical protein n=1 Tax=Halomonas sp. S2151 TaxID=579478 RepID=UPI0005F9C2ED|nr:hypothetical protein [Halomonas sp. S2151]KJZ10425.1 hypothetical protein TW86_14090 [Halomonas sp. S2151]
MGNAAEKLDTPQPYAAELIELNDVEKQLAELRAKHGTVPDYSTKEGYARGKASIKELTSYRTGTDKARLAITKPHREFIDQVNQYAKGLIAEIETLESPHRDAKQEVDEAEKRKKEERIAKLRARLDKEVTAFLDTAVGLDSAGLAELIDAAESIETENYFDVTKEAEDEKARVLRELRDQHSRAQERERLATERAEIERQKAELECLKAQQAPADPAPGDVATAGGTVFSQEAPDDWEDLGNALQDVPSADPFGDALEDLQDLGLDPSQAVDVLSAIQRGEVRHLAFRT